VQKIIQNLLDLQSVEVRLNEVRSRLAAFPKQLAEVDAQVNAAKAEVEKANASKLAALKDRKKYELDVEQWKEKIRKYKDQTAQIKTNDAYKALQHEIQMAEQELAKSEDRLLEQMVASEEYDRKIKTAEKSLKETEEVARGERGKIETAKSAAEQELSEASAGRAAALEGIPEDLLDHYERIARKHNGIALAPVRDEKCGACGMRVRPAVFQQMRSDGSQEIFHCETCTRILYYVPPAAAAANQASAATTAPSKD
jgi:predicted  nucleic acid-binding Zn-ribbon protein